MFQPADSIESVPSNATPSSPLTPPIPSATFEPFLLLPEARKFFTGEARNLPIQNFWALVFFIFFTFMAVCLMLGALYDQSNATRLHQSGVMVDATVTDRRISSGKSTSYYLTYEFHPRDRDQVFTHDQQVSSRTYYAHIEGSLISVAYLPNDPTISRLAGKDADDSVMETNVWLSLVFVGFTFIALFFLIRPIVWDRSLARNGRIIQGALVSVDGRMTGGRGSYFKLMVRYQFVSPEGETLYGKQDAKRNDLHYTELPTPGTPVAVLYAGNRQHKML